MSDGGRRCGSCGSENLADAQFCAVCGVALSSAHLEHPGLAALVDDDGATAPEHGDVAPPAEPAIGSPAPAAVHADAPEATAPMAASPADPRPAPTAVASAVPASPVIGRDAPERAWILPTMIVFVVLAIAAVVLVVATAGGDGDATPTPTDPVATIPSTDTTTPPSTAVDTTTPATTATETTAPEVSTSSPETTTSSPETTVVSPPDAAAQLAAIASADLDRVLSLRERWVPQLSAKEDGTTWEGITYDLSGIVDLHESLGEQVGGALLAEGSTLAFLRNGERMAGWWFTLADVDFDDADGALQWCADAGFDRANCAARLLTDRDDATGTLVLRPAE